jgi:hypothetical protein
LVCKKTVSKAPAEGETIIAPGVRGFCIKLSQTPPEDLSFLRRQESIFLYYSSTTHSLQAHPDDSAIFITWRKNSNNKALFIKKQPAFTFQVVAFGFESLIFIVLLFFVIWIL